MMKAVVSNPGVSMRQLEIVRFGSTDVMQIREVPIPVPGEGEVLVKVHSIGINFADIFARQGYYPGIPRPPFVPGLEFSGVVAAVGRKVRSLPAGTRVLGFSRLGAYAEFVCVPESHVTRMPPKMTFDQGAAIGVTFLTAYHGLLTLGHVKKGEKLLLHAAAGGVGTAALQIAKHLGIYVFATVGSDSKIDVVRELGADSIINYSSDDFAEHIRRETNGTGVDVVLDSIGGRVMRKGWGLLAPMGRYILFGFAAASGPKGISKLRALTEAASVPVLFPASLVSKNVTFSGFNLFFLFEKTDYLRQAMKTMLAWYRQGIVKPIIGGTFPFERMGDAHAFLQSRKSIGKVVVTIEQKPN